VGGCIIEVAVGAFYKYVYILWYRGVQVYTFHTDPISSWWLETIPSLFFFTFFDVVLTVAGMGSWTALLWVSWRFISDGVVVSFFSVRVWRFSWNVLVVDGGLEVLWVFLTFFDG